MKPGIKSTEFWVVVGVQIVGLLLTLGIFTPEQASAFEKAIPQLGGIAAMLAASFGYSISRGEAKKGEAIANGKIKPTYPGDPVKLAQLDLIAAKIKTEHARKEAFESRAK